jgi:hypothetical protein
MTEPLNVVVIPHEDPDFRAAIPAIQVDFERTQKAGFYSDVCLDAENWSTEEGFVLISDYRDGESALDLGLNEGEVCELTFGTEAFDPLTYAGSWIEHEIPAHRFEFGPDQEGGR